MISIPTILLYALTLYAAVGVVIGIAFVMSGVTRVFERPTPVSPGARVLLFPASAALWPLVLRRWMKSQPAR
jgi:hypothetical protein